MSAQVAVALQVVARVLPYNLKRGELSPLCLYVLRFNHESDYVISTKVRVC